MTGQKTQLILDLDTVPAADVEELAELTQHLREELLELDVEAVDFVSAGETPAKAKAGDPVTWGSLLVTLAASGGVIVTLIKAVDSWLTRQDSSSVTIEIEGDKLTLTGGPYSEEQKKAIDVFMTRHRGFVVSNE